MKTKRYCLTLDLKADPKAIVEYDRHHQAVWPEILKSLQDAGIHSMKIYRWQNRLFMIMECMPDFSFERKATLDAGNPKVVEWEKLMWQYQQSLPGVKAGEKWQLMEEIFDFESKG